MLEQLEIRLGDCIELMREMDENSIDAICTDPPLTDLSSWARTGIASTVGVTAGR